MPDRPDSLQRTRISRATWTWLESESADWESRGLVSAAARRQILDGYEVLSAERRSLLALTVIGALMLGIGVLLLIGYNWQRVPVAGKILLIMASVALAYAGAAWSYRQQRRQTGETFAFVGVLLFGSAIWLIAQVLHISGNFADGFLWWAIGGLTTAVLVRSRAVGIAAAALVLMWAFAAALGDDRPLLPFIALWGATLAAVYALRSRWLLVSTVFALIVWASTVGGRGQPETAVVAVAALTACACYSIGARHPGSFRLGRSWQVSGLAVLLVLFTPLLFAEFHSNASRQPIPVTSMLVAAASLAVTLWSAVRGFSQSPARDVAGGSFADGAVTITAIAIAIWLGVHRVASRPAASGLAATLVFSVLALLLSVALIHRSLRRDRAGDLTMGVLFAVLFLLVRWVSVMDSMLWSGVMLLLASAGFFAIARLWSRRQRVALPSGSHPT
jgi:uncharacterized membrane protein